MNKGRDDDRFRTSTDMFRTSTDLYGGFDTDYDNSYQLNTGSEAADTEDNDTQPVKKKKRRKKHYFLRFLGVAAFLILLYLFLTSPVFTIDDIEVENNTLISDDEILEMAQVSPGDNLFKITEHKLKSRLSDNKYIEDVDIRRELPDRLIISITERMPVIAVKSGGKYVIIDEDGIAIDEADDNMYATVLEGVSISDYELGKVPSFDDSGVFEEVRDMVVAVNASGMFFKKVDVQSSFTVKCYVTDTLICSGDIDNIVANIESIKVILYDLDQKGVKRGIIKVGEDGNASFSPVTE